VVRIKRSVCHSSGIDLVAEWLSLNSAMPMVVGSSLILVPSASVIMTACMFEFVGLFLYFFKAVAIDKPVLWISKFENLFIHHM